MSYVSKTALGAAAMAMTGGQALAQAPRPCVTQEEVRAIVLVLLPDALGQVGEACAAELPATALLRRADAPIFARYQAEVAPNRALAATAFAKIAGADEKTGALLGNEAGAQLMSAFIAPMIAKEVKAKDCGAINAIVEHLEPLPPQNLAGLFATILQLTERDKAAKDKKNDIPVCPAPG